MSILVIILVLLAVVAGGVYLQVDPRYTSYDLQANIPPRFGIPPWLKRELEEKALDTLGENKASYLTKSYVEKIPASDQKDVKELKTGFGNAAGGALQNPLGKFVCSIFIKVVTIVTDILITRLVTLRTMLPSLSLVVESAWKQGSKFDSRLRRDEENSQEANRYPESSRKRIQNHSV